jgi:hypothetical protein
VNKRTLENMGYVFWLAGLDEEMKRRLEIKDSREIKK